MKPEDLYSRFLETVGIATDSRKDVENKMFVALEGERFDGHDYVGQALQNGAAFALVHHSVDIEDERLIFTTNTLEALQDLANHHRLQLKAHVLGITGSNGKTTTKELVVSVLRENFKVHATSGNFNNLIGLPLTILACPADVDILILEMGTNAPGEIEALANIAQPDSGLITNIGDAHLEGLGTLQGVLHEKTALYRNVMDRNGTVFVPVDSAGLARRSNDALHRRFFGLADDDRNSRGGDLITVTRVLPGIEGSFKVEDKIYQFSSILMGLHNARNCAAAISVGRYFNIEPDAIVRGLSKYQPIKNRSQLIRAEGVTVILDAYNANPVSMNKSLDVLEEWPGRNKIVVLGDMKELGEETAKAHYQIICRVSGGNYEHVILVGDEMKKQDNSAFTDLDDAGIELKRLCDSMEDVVVLLKASRSIGLERLLPYLGINME